MSTLLFTPALESLNGKNEVIPVDEAKFTKQDERGKFTAVKLAKWENTARKEDRPSMHFPIKAPHGRNIYPIAPDGGEGRWRVGKRRMQELLDNDLVYWGGTHGNAVPYEKIYANGLVGAKDLKRQKYNF